MVRRGQCIVIIYYPELIDRKALPHLWFMVTSPRWLLNIFTNFSVCLV